MEAHIKDGKLIIVLSTNKPAVRSSSGKTLVLASTRGNKQVNINGQTVYIGVNAYVYPDQEG